MKTTSETVFGEKYTGVAELDHLHKQSREWLSDMAFWKDEAIFLKRLIDKNFVHLMTGEGLSTAIKLSEKISHLIDIELKNLTGLVEIHEGKLAELLENPQSKREEAFLKIEFINNAYWRVTDKNGVKYYFGEDQSSQEYDPADSGRIFKWATRPL